MENSPSNIPTCMGWMKSEGKVQTNPHASGEHKHEQTLQRSMVQGSSNSPTKPPRPYLLSAVKRDSNTQERDYMSR